jgi:predicted acetyltransferase
VENERILWAIQIRHSIDHPRLIEVGGHIGYGIRPSERGKWYATEMLRLWLLEAKKLWLEKVLITCHDDNIASAKVIENNGGAFERYAYRDEKKYRRYWVNTTQ